MAKVRRFFWNLIHHQQVILAKQPGALHPDASSTSKANPIFILEQIDKMDIYAYF
jgi:hypothetical protein